MNAPTTTPPSNPWTAPAKKCPLKVCRHLPQLRRNERGDCCRSGVDVPEPSTASVIGRGIVAGVAGTVVMTAFQKFTEIPLTKRHQSYAPADFAEKVTPADPTTPEGRRRLNYVAHFSLGMMWGAAYGVAQSAACAATRASTPCSASCTSATSCSTPLWALYQPTGWSTQGLVVDVVDKYVQAQATGLVFDRLLDPAA